MSIFPYRCLSPQSGPILAVNTTGVLFQARQNGGSSVTNNIEILNIGDPNSTVNWTASLVSGSNWLSLVSSSGTGNPGRSRHCSRWRSLQNATQIDTRPVLRPGQDCGFEIAQLAAIC